MGLLLSLLWRPRRKPRIVKSGNFMNPDDDNWEPQTEEEAKAAIEEMRFDTKGLTIKDALKRALSTPSPPPKPGVFTRMPTDDASNQERNDTTD